MQKITPFLTFAFEAEEAMNFYLGIFKDSKVININRYSKGKGTIPAAYKLVESKTTPSGVICGN